MTWIAALLTWFLASAGLPTCPTENGAGICVATHPAASAAQSARTADDRGDLDGYVLGQAYVAETEISNGF